MVVAAAVYTVTMALGISATVSRRSFGQWHHVFYFVSCATAALADSTGKSLAIVQQEFTGVGSPATLVGISSIDPTTIQVIFNVPMSDDALLPSQ